jgi:SAM-dependent methyltransferase
MSYDKDDAVVYEDDREHALPPGEANAWLAEMRRLAGHSPLQGRLLDVGAGTGLLTVAMKEAGLSVSGLEPSSAMIAEGLRRHLTLQQGDFVIGQVIGQADDTGLFTPQSFEWVVSRQVLCHLCDPEKAFATWHSWLKPGGHAVLVDGFWPRSSWPEFNLVNQPFAALTDVAPLANALSGAGFRVLKAETFQELNEGRESRSSGSRPRYVVVGVKP